MLAYSANRRCNLVTSCNIVITTVIKLIIMDVFFYSQSVVNCVIFWSLHLDVKCSVLQ